MIANVWSKRDFVVRGVALVGLILVVGGQFLASSPLTLLSHDRGSTWQRIETPSSARLTAVAFADENNGWVLAGERELLTTSDGGLTWQSTTWSEGSVHWGMGAVLSARSLPLTRVAGHGTEPTALHSR
jgi:hypothetical protein